MVQYFTTDSFQTNDEGDGVIGDYDLQVKPNYLVNPTGSYGYWFTEIVYQFDRIQILYKKISKNKWKQNKYDYKLE